MTKHTPGPWVNQEGSYFINARGLTGVVADIRLAGGVITAEHRANARLIAAAPDLLAALQGLAWAVSGIEYVETEYAEQVAQARAAIAKAQGEG